MKCLHPVTIRAPEKYRLHASAFHQYVPKYIQVPCGHCVECYKLRRMNWVIRMEKELAVSSSCFFVTLTYEENSLPRVDGVPTLSKEDHQLFMKRLRKVYGNGIRFFMCGEYGSTFDRPHMHYVLFNLPHSLDETKELWVYGTYRSPELEEIWQKGIVQFGPITPGGMSYVAKYCQWQEEGDLSTLLDCQVKPFSLMSRRPGIGENYLDNGWSSLFMYRNGHKVATPRYYRAKMDLPKFYGSIPADIDDKSVSEIKDLHENERRYFKRQKTKKQKSI